MADETKRKQFSETILPITNFANISRIVHKLSHFNPQVKIVNELFQ